MPIEQTRVWTVRELMKSAIEHLQRKGFEDARLNVELLLAHALELQRIQLYLHFDKPLKAEELKHFRDLYERRLNHEPVQYIIGSTSFMGLHFSVDTGVLIPRPETETLIEQVLLLYQSYPRDYPVHILEIGTGSGNIAVSLAKFIRHAHIATLDVSAEALILAKKNAQFHAVEHRIQFHHGDVFEENDELFQMKYDLLVSNPPYVPKDEWEQLQPEIRDYEPSRAVTDGRDGMRFYQRIAALVPAVIKPGGYVAVEVGFGQAVLVAKELHLNGIEELRKVADLQGVDRVVTGMKPSPERTVFSVN
jgi:release factor glutamine methyltransferase